MNEQNQEQNSFWRQNTDYTNKFCVSKVNWNKCANICDENALAKEHGLVSQRSITSNTHEMMIEKQYRNIVGWRITQHKVLRRKTNVLLCHAEWGGSCLFSSTFSRRSFASFLLLYFVISFSFFIWSRHICILWKKDLFLDCMNFTFAVFLYSSLFSLWSWTETVRKQQEQFSCRSFRKETK